MWNARRYGWAISSPTGTKRLLARCLLVAVRDSCYSEELFVSMQIPCCIAYSTHGSLDMVVCIAGEQPVIKLIRDKITGYPSGYVFLEFPSLEGARYVLEHFNGQIVRT